MQGAEEPKLKWEHITTLISSLREFVRSTDRKIIATTLSKLKLELDFDSHGISQVQVVLFSFQDAVSACATIPPPPQLCGVPAIEMGFDLNSTPFHVSSSHDRCEVFIEFPQRQETHTAQPPWETARLTDISKAGVLLGIQGWAIIWLLKLSAH